MSPVQIAMCAAAALTAMAILVHVLYWLSDRAALKSGNAAEPEKPEGVPFLKRNAVVHTKGRILLEGCLMIAAGVAIVAWMGLASHWAKYGAFYDNAWRDPSAADHFIWTNEDTEALQKLYDADPEGFDFDARKAIIVTLGCPDCENAKDAITALQATGDYYVVFSASRIGRAYMEHYDISWVPSVTYSGLVIELRGTRLPDPEPSAGIDIDRLIDEIIGAGLVTPPPED